MGPRPISFLSDYGYEDEFAGICRAVIAGIAPQARIIDLTHGVPRQDVRRGAVALADALPYLPAGVHVAVIDPGVGAARRPVAVRAGDEDRILIGPDNGLLWPAIEALGGAAEAVDLAVSPFRLDPIAATFEGRDVFAPVAARLALGTAVSEAGEPLEVGSLTRLELPTTRVEGDRVLAQVLYLDRFGNATLNTRPEELGEGRLRIGGTLTVEVGEAALRVPFARYFAEVGEGEMLLYEDSSRRLALAVNRGSAARRLEIGPGSEIALSPG